MKRDVLGVPVHLFSIVLYSVGEYYFVVCEIGSEFLLILYLESTVFCLSTACFGNQQLFIFRIQSMCFV